MDNSTETPGTLAAWRCPNPNCETWNEATTIFCECEKDR